MHTWNSGDRLRRLLHCTKIKDKYVVAARIVRPHLSSSIFDFDFGTGFDDFGVKAFDDFGADFERVWRWRWRWSQRWQFAWFALVGSIHSARFAWLALGSGRARGPG